MKALFFRKANEWATRFAFFNHLAPPPLSLGTIRIIASRNPDQRICLAFELNLLVKVLFKPGGHVERIREDSVMTKNVVNALVNGELTVQKWLPLGETTPLTRSIHKLL